MRKISKPSVNAVDPQMPHRPNALLRPLQLAALAVFIAISAPACGNHPGPDRTGSRNTKPIRGVRSLSLRARALRHDARTGRYIASKPVEALLPPSRTLKHAEPQTETSPLPGSKCTV